MKMVWIRVLNFYLYIALFLGTLVAVWGLTEFHFSYFGYTLDSVAHCDDT